MDKLNYFIDEETNELVIITEDRFFEEEFRFDMDDVVHLCMDYKEIKDNINV